jgi:hypothetical protein
VNLVSNPIKTLRVSIIDAVIDGTLGNGIVVTRQQVMSEFNGKFADKYLSVILSNSEIDANQKGYRPFTIRIDEGKYQIHPLELLYRMHDRKLV